MQILKCYRRKRKPPSQTGSSFLFCSSNLTSFATTVRSARREFRPAQDARYHGMPGGLSTLVPAPLRRTNNEDAPSITEQIFCCFFMSISSCLWESFCLSISQYKKKKRSPRKSCTPILKADPQDDDAQCILAEYTYTITSAPFLEI